MIFYRSNERFIYPVAYNINMLIQKNGLTYLYRFDKSNKKSIWNCKDIQRIAYIVTSLSQGNTYLLIVEVKI